MSYLAIHSTNANDSNFSMKFVIDALILATVFVFNTLALGVDWQGVAIAIGGSFSGAVILAYFRRDPRKLEQMFKVACSSIGGLVVGTVLQEYFQVINPKYQLGLFFATSMLSLFLLRALNSVTEKNAAEVCRDIIQRLLGLQLKDERQKMPRRSKQKTLSLEETNQKDGEN
jgi:hypothetical protein